MRASMQEQLRAQSSAYKSCFYMSCQAGCAAATRLVCSKRAGGADVSVPLEKLLRRHADCQLAVIEAPLPPLS